MLLENNIYINNIYINYENILYYYKYYYYNYNSKILRYIWTIQFFKLDIFLFYILIFKTLIHLMKT